MKDENFEKMLKFVLQEEGGYVNDPHDRGGETNKGITHTTYDSYRKSKGLPTRSVKNITDDEVRDIYYNNYYKASGADKLGNPQLSLYVFDTAVNMGVSRAKEFLNKSNGNAEVFQKLRLAKYEEFAKVPDQKQYLKTWTNRINRGNVFAKNNLPNTTSTNNQENDNKNPILNNYDFNKLQMDNISNNLNDYSQYGNELFKLGIEYNDYQQNNLPDLNDLMVNPIEQQIQKTNPWDMIPMAIPENLRQPSGIPTGQAANFDINQLANMLGIQLQNVQSTNQPKQNLGLYGYINPLTSSNHIYTREEVGQMNSSEFAKHEKEIDAQTEYFKGTMPTNGDLQREAMTGGGVVYVNSYTRSDGTEVKGYYRSR